MPTSETTGPVTISVDIDGTMPDEPWRTGLTYTITVNGDEPVQYVGNDLSVGIGGDDATIEREALYSVVSFLTACHEGIAFEERNPGHESDNSDLFPRWLIEALDPHIEDVQYIGMDPHEWPDSHFKGETTLDTEITDWLFEEGRALPYGCSVKVPLLGVITPDDRAAAALVLSEDCWHEVTRWDTLDESSDRGYTEIVLEWVA